MPIAADAQEARELCPSRPGLGTPACIVDAGRVLAETGLASFEREDDGDLRTDTLIAADSLVRLGLDGDSEVQLGWTAFGRVRERDAITVDVVTQSGLGDVSLAYKRSLANPDGSGWSVAVQPFATLPVGGEAIGAGDWGAGLLVPVTGELGGGVSFELTPRIDAAVDEDRSGRHLAYGSVIGIELAVSDAVSLTLEGSALRDNDPDGRRTEMLGAAALAWQPGDDVQIDAGGAVGLNRDSPDFQLYLGVARRF
ncbi:transporter [Sphingomonas sp. S1-29]|uniref:transporter n=1 Tax=Sphingomonas sp. S1-29 TaxID=2991074 RepID=UPI0022403FFC|nr:transporter [Sphingomonas sp. S1-29]UZK71033.1 transporter [Sphingomonas sp. S1-29]